MFFDTDCGGVVHNIAYLRWIETARTRLAAKLGLSLRDMAETGLFAVVVRTEIDYRLPVRLGDHVHIHGEIERIERARFWCRFRLVSTSAPPDDVRPEDAPPGPERLHVTCRQALALVQMPRGRPVRLPADWESRFPEVCLPTGSQSSP